MGVNHRNDAGLNPAVKEGVILIVSILHGDNLIRGFRNFDFRQAIDGTSDESGEHLRQSRAIGRMLKRLHVRDLIATTPRTRRWNVTSKGSRILGAIIRLDHHGIPERVDRAS